MSDYEQLREIKTARFTVRLRAHPEYQDPIDTIAWDDPSAEHTYAQTIYSGACPWFVLGAHVFAEGVEIGSSYLGCVDTYDLRSVGVRDVVHEAIEEARQTIARISTLG